MSPEAVAADRAYRDLKIAVTNGRFELGAPLNVHAVAKELDMSISPVRDALHRLVGERLLAARAGGGFELPLMAPEYAADLYRWHAFLLRGAAKVKTPLRLGDDLRRSLDHADQDDEEAMIAITAELFYRLGEGAGNVEHLLAIRSAGERLAPLRRGEAVLRDRKGELGRLLSMAVQGHPKPLRRAVDVYHRRRLRNLVAIINALPSTAIAEPLSR